MADTQVMLSSFSFSLNLSPQSHFSSQTLDLLYAKAVGKALLESGVRKVEFFCVCVIGIFRLIQVIACNPNVTLCHVQQNKTDNIYIDCTLLEFK